MNKKICCVLLKVYALLIITSFLSCNNKTTNEDITENFSNNNGDYLTFLLDDESEKNEGLIMSSLFRSAKPILLEITDSSLIGKISKLEEFDNKLIILDSFIAKSIFVFDMDGHFLRRIGNLGEGPGEYSRISDFTIDRDNGNIYALDDNRQVVNIYRLSDGMFLDKINIRKDGLVSFNIQYVDGQLYVDNYYTNNKKGITKFMLRTIDINTGKTNKLLLNVDDYNKGYNEMVFTGKGVFFSREKDPLYLQAYMDTILSLSRDQVSPHIVLKSEYLTVKEDLLNNNSKDRRNYNSASIFDNLIQSKKFHSFEYLIETDEFILIQCLFKNLFQLLYYDKKEKKTTVYNFFNDDVLFKFFDFKKNKTSIDYLFDTSKGVYFVIQRTSDFINDINQYGFNEGVNYNFDLSEINSESNPMIIYYEFK